MLPSSSSDSSNSSFSSAAERRDSTEFGTLMESVCGTCHNPAKESHAEAAAEAGEAQQDSRNSRSSLPEAHSSTAVAGPGGAPSTAVAESGDISTTAAEGSDAASATTTGSDASAATAAATDAERANRDMDATAGIDTGDGAITEDTSRASHLDGSLPPNARESSRASENAASEPDDVIAPAVSGHHSLASSAHMPAAAMQHGSPYAFVLHTCKISR